MANTTIARVRLDRSVALLLVVALTVPLHAGTEAQGASSIGQHPADVGIPHDASPNVVNETEPNNAFGSADAIDLALGERYGVVAGTITPGGDVDFFSIAVANAGSLWIATDTGGTQGAGATGRDTIIDLLAPDGTTVIETDDDDGTGTGGDGTVESGEASMIGGRTVPVGGTYFIRVRGFAATDVINPYRLFVMVTIGLVAEVETNNSAAAANRIVAVAMPIGVRSGAIGAAGDVDYYSVVANARSVVFFSADADPERDGTGTDVVVEFRSPADVVLLTVDSSDTGSPADPAAEGGNYTITTDGTYFIRVRHAANGTGTYHLMVIASVNQETEPNATAGTADLIDLSPSTQRCAIVLGAINPAGDVDFYSFTAAAGSRVWIETDTGGVQVLGSTSRDTLIDLLAADGVTVIETDDDDGTGNDGDNLETGLASIIGGRTLVTGGTYYIRVQAFGGVDVINPYRLFVVVTNTAAKAEVEGNNTAVSANPIATSSVAIGLRSGAIGSNGDVDYYSVVAKDRDVIYFNADADPERDGTGTDLVVSLRSSFDTELLSVNSSLGGTLADPAAEGANYTIQGDGTYYLRVSHVNPAGQGTYHLMTIVASGTVFPSFTDSPLAVGVSVVRALHFTELRSRIDALRVRFDLAPFAWTHPSLNGAVIETEDVADLRSALQAAYAAAGVSAPVFMDSPLVPQTTPIRAVHINQLRAAVLALESS